MAGRRTKYTEETVAKIEQAISIGATYKLAAQYAGINEATLHEWRNKKPEFSERLSRAEGKAAIQSLATIRAAAPQDWRAASWLLERRYPDEYGKRERIDIKLTVQQEVERLVAAGLLEPDEAADAIAEAEAIVRGKA